MLAMEAGTTHSCCCSALSLTAIASRLAPTGEASSSGCVRKHIGTHLMSIHPGVDQRVQRPVDHRR